jgi:23S rRNA (guanosine2251-2'-O)-methyltransferase
MADGESPKGRPKRVKPDRPRPTTSSFRPTGGGSRPGGSRPGGPRPSGGGSRPGSGFRPDTRIPPGPDERPPDDRPGADRPSGGRPWPGRPQGDRPRFDGPRQGRSGFGFRARPDGPPRWQEGPSGPGPRPGRDDARGGDRGRDEDGGRRPPDRPFREQAPRPRFERPGRGFERPASNRSEGFARPPRFQPDSAPPERPRPDEASFDRPSFDRPARSPGGRPYGADPRRPDRDRPDRGRPAGPRPFGPRPERPYVDRDRPDFARPDFARPATFNRPGLEPAEAGLIESGDEIVAGRRPVEEAFVARREARRLLVVPQRRGALEKLVLHATSLRIPIVEVEGGSMTALTGFDGHQGIALVVAPRRYASVADILARAIERDEAPFVLVLDSLEDPQNVGTLLRSAEAAGAHGVIFPTRRQAPLSPAAVKASAGAVEHLLLAPVDDLAGALADLHVAGLRVVGAEADAPMTVREADLRGPIALVVGSEGQGLGPAVRRRCDLTVRIPMRGVIGSLNASVAGSILLFEATTQRGDAPPVLKARGALPTAPRPASIPRDAESGVEAVPKDGSTGKSKAKLPAPEAPVALEVEPAPEAVEAAVIAEEVAAPAKRAKRVMAGAKPKAPTKLAKVTAKAAKANKTAAKTTKTVAKAGAKTRKKADASAETLDPGDDVLP